MPRTIRDDRLSLCRRGPRSFEFVNLRVDHEPVPETLQKVKYEARQAVEKSEQNEIAEEPVKKRAQKTRRAPVESVFEESLAGSGRARIAGCDYVLGLLKRCDLVVGEAVMLVDPERDALAVFIDDVVLEPLDPAARHEHVLVHGAILAACRAFAPNPQQPRWIIPAVPDPTSPEVYSPLQHQAADLVRNRREFVHELVPQRLAQPLIRIQAHHPIAVQRQIVDRPVQLARMGFKRMRHDIA